MLGQHSTMVPQLALQSMPVPPPDPGPPPDPTPPPEPVVPPVLPIARQPPVWHEALQSHVPTPGSLQDPFAVLVARLPLQVPDPSPKLMEFPLTEPVYVVPVGEQFSVMLQPFWLIEQEVSWQVPDKVQLPDTSGQLPPPPPESLELQESPNAANAAPTKTSRTHLMHLLVSRSVGPCRNSPCATFRGSQQLRECCRGAGLARNQRATVTTQGVNVGTSRIRPTPTSRRSEPPRRPDPDSRVP